MKLKLIVLIIAVHLCSFKVLAQDADICIFVQKELNDGYMSESTLYNGINDFSYERAVSFFGDFPNKIDINNDGKDEVLRLTSQGTGYYTTLYILKDTILEDEQLLPKIAEFDCNFDFYSCFGKHIIRSFGYHLKTRSSYAPMHYKEKNYLLRRRADHIELIEFNDEYKYKVICNFNQLEDGSISFRSGKDDVFKEGRHGEETEF